MQKERGYKRQSFHLNAKIKCLILRVGSKIVYTYFKHDDYCKNNCHFIKYNEDTCFFFHEDFASDVNINRHIYILKILCTVITFLSMVSVF